MPYGQNTVQIDELPIWYEYKGSNQMFNKLCLNELKLEICMHIKYLQNIILYTCRD